MTLPEANENGVPPILSPVSLFCALGAGWGGMGWVGFLPKEGMESEPQLSPPPRTASGHFFRPEKSPSPMEHKSRRDLQAISGFCPVARLSPKAVSTVLTTGLGVGVSGENTGEQKPRLESFRSQNILAATPVGEIPASLHYSSKFNILCVRWA